MDLNALGAHFPKLDQLSPLSQGGQKDVCSAVHADFGPVVLKLIRNVQDPERLRREVLEVAQLDLPRVPKLRDHGQLPGHAGGCNWIIEDRVLGTPLNVRIAQAPLDEPRTAQLAVQVLEVLVATEAAQVIHRDIKPANILIENATESAWLIDFGIARHTGLVSLTPDEHPMGPCTAGYAPVEQFMNLQLDLDHRADLFALGVTLHESLVGSNPFVEGAANRMEIYQRVQNRSLPSISPTTCSREFDEFIRTLAQRNKIHRPRSSNEALAWAREFTK